MADDTEFAEVADDVKQECESFGAVGVALIGGAQYTGNSSGQNSLAPQLGAQIHGVPLVVTHDFETNTTTLGVTFKFGR